MCGHPSPCSIKLSNLISQSTHITPPKSNTFKTKLEGKEDGTKFTKHTPLTASSKPEDVKTAHLVRITELDYLVKRILSHRAPLHKPFEQCHSGQRRETERLRGTTCREPPGPRDSSSIVHKTKSPLLWPSTCRKPCSSECGELEQAACPCPGLCEHTHTRV